MKLKVSVTSSAKMHTLGPNYGPCHKLSIRKRLAAFTLVEAMVAISVLGIGLASTVGALTRFNSIASISRNASGACTAVMRNVFTTGEEANEGTTL